MHTFTQKDSIMTDIKAKTPEERNLQIALARDAIQQTANAANRPEKTKVDASEIKDGVEKAPSKSKTGVAASMLPDEEREEAKSLQEIERNVRDAAAARPELVNK